MNPFTASLPLAAVGHAVMTERSAEAAERAGQGQGMGRDEILGSPRGKITMSKLPNFPSLTRESENEPAHDTL